MFRSIPPVFFNGTTLSKKDWGSLHFLTDKYFSCDSSKLKILIIFFVLFIFPSQIKGCKKHSYSSQTLVLQTKIFARKERY